MLVLFECAAGYAVFNLLDERKLKEVDNLYKDFETPEAASDVVKLKYFRKFQDTTEALAAATAAVEGKMSKSLKKLLKKLVVGEAQEQLAVADAKLGSVIKEKLNLSCVANNSIQELMRCIRAQADGLISGLPQKELSAMSLGLAHSLSRYKLKFSPDKVDTMIVQAISLLDDVDKELNNYVMRCREWYGWHFPELGKIITDNLAFVKTVKIMGVRTNASTCDLSNVLPENIEEEVKQQAEISMGSEISDDDILNITHLCDQVIELTEYRASLYDYLKQRMMAIAPNVTALVGELVGARLIAHAGSLLNLAKHPASTVQILGAEKALFRAMKTKHDTPKYGLLYHASLVGQSNPKQKGKMARMLGAKTALMVRKDALGDDIGDAELGIEVRAKLELRIKAMEEAYSRKVSGSGKGKPQWDKYENKSSVKSYNDAQDSTLGKKRKIEEIDESESKPKKIKLEQPETPSTSVTPKASKVHQDADTDDTESAKKSKKNKKKRMSEGVVADEVVMKSEELADDDEAEGASSAKKDKKKKKKRKSVEAESD
jgi:nucleolar protein 58